MDEAELIRSARRGDRSALDELFRLHADAVLTHARHRIDPRWRALLTPEDVLQTTCIDAMRHIAGFAEGRGSFVQWLKRIAENNIIDTVRGLEAEERRSARAVGAGCGGVRFGHRVDASVSLVQSLIAAETGSTPSRQLTAEEAKRILEWALEQLPSEHRRVVEWYDLEGRPIAAIAEEIGKTPGATYMIRTRAHDRLRELLTRKASAFFSNP